MEITITTPRGFSFKRTAFSHGWTELPPFEVDAKTGTIRRVLDSALKTPLTVVITGEKRALRVSVPRKSCRRLNSSAR